jgi:hypothetical protein
MDTRASRDLPARLEGLRRRFNQWRRTRQSRSRIPEPLWTAAAKAAGRYGIHQTAKALGLDYYSLKRRAEKRTRSRRATPSASKVPAADGPTTFVELPTAAWSACGECTLELEHPSGAKLHVSLKGLPAPDLAALAGSFLQSES